MTKTISIFSLCMAVVAATAGGYFYLTRTETIRVESQHVETPPLVREPDPLPKPKPEHGDFNKRFEPKPPPTDGGK